MEWTEEDQKNYDSIVDNLRRQGWDRYDAMEEADIKTANRYKNSSQESKK